MKFALGKKQRMTQIFDEDGTVHPVTTISLEPMTVTSIKNPERDGYFAVQVGYGTKKNSFEGKKEFKGECEGYKIGDSIDVVSLFEKGDVVKISSKSKGKGFQGVVKRYGFKGGPRTHGQKHTERAPGSIGGGLPTRVAKGKKMPGRMGSDRVTIKGTEVVRIDPKNSILLVRGSVPGRVGSLIEIVGI